MKDTIDLILQKGRKKNVTRDVAIYLSRDLTGESSVDLANILATYPAPTSQSGTIIWQSRFSSIAS
jgi:hypothetical protein